MRGVAITGMGIISSIGRNVQENYAALAQAQNGISTISNINTRHKDAIKVGEVKSTNEVLCTQLQLF